MSLLAAAFSVALSVVPQHVIHAHTAELRRIAFSADSRMLATSSVDGTAKVWSIPDAKLLHVFKHPIGATAVAFSPDGQWIATSSYDGSVRIWGLADAKLLRTISGAAGTLWCVAISADGRHVAAAGEDKMVRIWRTSDGALEHTLRGHTLNIWAIAFSPDGSLLASGSFDHDARLWRVRDGSLVKTLSGHKEAIVGLSFSRDGQRLATSGDDATVRIWRASDGATLRILHAENHIYDVAFSPDGRYVAGGGRESGAIGTLWKQIAGPSSKRGTTLRVWRIADGALVQQLSGQTDDVFSIDWSRDGRWIATGSDDKTVWVWRVRD